MEDALDDLHFRIIDGVPALLQLHLFEVVDEGQGDSHVPLSFYLKLVEDVNEEEDLVVGHELLLLGQQGREGLKDEFYALLLQFAGLLYEEVISVTVDLGFG